MEISTSNNKTVLPQFYFKNLILFFFLLFSTVSFGQFKDNKKSYTIDSKKISEQYKENNPLVLTNDNILLNITKVETLNSLKKIKTLSVIQSNEGKNLYGELAKNGMLIVELQDTIIKSENLLDLLKRTHPESDIAISNILINGNKITDEKIKFPKWDKLMLDFDSKSNRYNIKAD